MMARGELRFMVRPPDSDHAAPSADGDCQISADHVIVRDRATERDEHRQQAEREEHRVQLHREESRNRHHAAEHDRRDQAAAEHLRAVGDELLCPHLSKHEAVDGHHQQVDRQQRKQLDDGAQPVGGQREQRVDRPEVRVAKQANAHLGHLRRHRCVNGRLLADVNHGRRRLAQGWRALLDVEHPPEDAVGHCWPPDLAAGGVLGAQDLSESFWWGGRGDVEDDTENGQHGPDPNIAHHQAASLTLDFGRSKSGSRIGNRPFTRRPATDPKYCRLGSLPRMSTGTRSSMDSVSCTLWPALQSPRCVSAPWLIPTRIVWMPVLPNVSTMKSCVGRSLERSANRLLRLPRAMRAASSDPRRLARSASVCIAQMEWMPPSAPLFRISIRGWLMTLAISSTTSVMRRVMPRL